MLGVRRSGLALGLGFLIWVISVYLSCFCPRLLWCLLRKYWGRAKWHPDRGFWAQDPLPQPWPSPRPQPVPPGTVRGRKGSGALENNLCDSNALSPGPPCLSVLLLSVCLSLPLSASVSLFLLHSVFLSFSLPPPLPHWALFRLPLCRDPWRSPMAWMCLTRARSTPSTCARSAKCWVTTAAVCNDRPNRQAHHPPASQRRRHPSVFLRVSMCGGALEGLRVWAWGVLGSCLMCIEMVLLT